MKIFIRYMTLGILLTLFAPHFLKAMDAQCPHCNHLRDECFSIKTTVKQKGGGASGKWNDDVTPKRGWTCTGAEDLGAGNSIQCEMCEREHPRYIHSMVHGNSTPLRVGCHCAAYMEGHLDDAHYLEGRLTAAKDRKNRLVRREHFPDLKKWKISRNGNPHITYNNSHITIFLNSAGRYCFSINNQFNRAAYNSRDEAKLAAFDQVDPQ